MRAQREDRVPPHSEYGGHGCLDAPAPTVRRGTCSWRRSASCWCRACCLPGPVAAHKFTKTDGNDSPGKLDLRSVVGEPHGDRCGAQVHDLRPWTSRSLGADSFFIIQIDKNDGPQRYERCAFIFYTNRLRGSLTNCRRAVHPSSCPSSKVSGTAAKITIPKSQTGNVYWWAGASLWVGPAPCAGRGCIDFAPNNFPDILHDMVLPVVSMTATTAACVGGLDGPDFTFPFSVSDAHSGIKSWTVQRRQVGSLSWTFVASGTSAGPKSPDHSSVEGTRLDYRVVAKDKQGNKKISPSRRVYIPA